MTKLINSAFNGRIKFWKLLDMSTKKYDWTSRMLSARKHPILNIKGNKMAKEKSTKKDVKKKPVKTAKEKKTVKKEKKKSK